ncbi:MAG: hypothetical protein C4518_18335 [Desulfobacteraceae bacterium]|nr:MAG: hypothetical protein C4518_18335 [Desulfobacteraceae bacterium]
MCLEIAGNQKLLRIFGPSRCVPDRRFSVEKGGNCLSDGKATHLMPKRSALMPQSRPSGQQASFSPATENRLAGK